MKNTLFYDKDKKPRLCPSFCVFLDFLGFSDLMAENEKDKEDTVFKTFIEKIEPLIKSHINIKPEDDLRDIPRYWDAKVFSDNTFLVHALWSHNYYHTYCRQEFGSLLEQVSLFQLKTALQGYFIRGGWTFGKLFINENTIFGKPLEEAVKLEKESNYPRIVLSDDVKQIVRAQIAQMGDPPPHVSHIFVDAVDGSWFVNYLSYASTLEGEILWSKLDKHAEIITKQLEKFAEGGDERILQKYEWLANYHNFYCNLCASETGESCVPLVKWDKPKCPIRLLTKEDYMTHLKNPTS